MRNDVREDSPPRSLEVDVLTAMVSGLHESGCERDLVRTAADTLRSHGDCPSHRKLGSGKPHPQHQGQTYTASRSPTFQRSRTSVASDTASQNEPGSKRKSAMIPVRRGEVDRSQRRTAEELRLACGCGLGALFDKGPSAPKANRGLEVLAAALREGEGRISLGSESWRALGTRKKCLAKINTTPRRSSALRTNVGLGTANHRPSPCVQACPSPSFLSPSPPRRV